MLFALSILALPLLGSALPTDLTERALPFLKSLPGTANILNSCPYPVYLQDTYPGSPPNTLTIPAKSRISPPLRSSPPCGTSPTPACGGVSMKIRKSPQGPPMQLEYLSTGGTLRYALNMIDCEGKGGCVGREGGYRVKAGEGCKEWVCPPGAECKEALTRGNGQASGRPVGVCKAAEGVVFELCAYMRAGP